MAKVKFKTQTNLDVEGSSRSSGRRSGRTTGRNSGRVSSLNQEAASAKKKSGGVLAFLVFMILAGGGGAAAFFYLDKQKEVTSYIITKQEADLVRQVNKRLELPAQSLSQLNFILGDLENFERKFTIAQIATVNGKEVRFVSPHIEEMSKVKLDVIEGIASAKRDKYRVVDYDNIQQTLEKARIEKERLALEERQKQEEAERIAAQKRAKEEAAAAIVAKGEALDEGKMDVRWEVLDSLMFDRSMFRPLEGKFSFNFVSSIELVDPWVKFPLDAQKEWGNGISKIYASARNTFGIISNSGTDYRGFKMFYEKREGTIMNISKQQFRIRVVDNVEGMEIPRSLERDIIDMPMHEFYNLLKQAVLPENLAKSKNASKNWEALKKLHPGISEDQVLEFGYACIMYMLKEFPSSRKSIERVQEISTDLLLEEINFVSPKHNRREMDMGIQTAQSLYDEGKRQDTLLILERMRVRFEGTKEWSEYKDQFVALKESANQIKKR
ncbi:MAG: hypothetical protein MK132_10905 [Lentisphaerales bacterium]|nr:hypothetical protein [Lentisphaerales bacterium]